MGLLSLELDFLPRAGQRIGLGAAPSVSGCLAPATIRAQETANPFKEEQRKYTHTHTHTHTHPTSKEFIYKASINTCKIMQHEPS